MYGLRNFLKLDLHIESIIEYQRLRKLRYLITDRKYFKFELLSHLKTRVLVKVCIQLHKVVLNENGWKQR